VSRDTQTHNTTSGKFRREKKKNRKHIIAIVHVLFYFLPQLEKKGALYSDGLHHAAPSRKQLVGGK
jgi:hypothetical protein